jgi:hypothetical protein
VQQLYYQRLLHSRCLLIVLERQVRNFGLALLPSILNNALFTIGLNKTITLPAYVQASHDVA